VTVKLPNEVVSSRLVEPAIIRVPTIDEIKGVFPWIVIFEGYSLLNEEVFSR
jgi:hypothetical protein